MVKELSHTSTYIHSHIMGSVDMSLSKFQEMVKDGDAVLYPMGSQRAAHDLVTKQQQHCPPNSAPIQAAI